MKPVTLRFEDDGVGRRGWLLGRRARISVFALAALTAGTLALVFICSELLKVESEAAAARQAIEFMRMESSNRSADATRARGAELTPQQRQAWAQIARQLNTPWTSLFNALESATPDNVAVVSIEPDAAHGNVRLQVEAKNLDTLLTYARELGSVPLFEAVSLTKHETYEQDSNKPVRLGVDIRLRNREELRR